MSLKPGSKFTINSRKYDGSIRRSWSCELVSHQGDVLDLIGRFDQRVDHPDLGIIEIGTISRERFYLNRWYNDFIFEQPDGCLRNLYINVCMPPRINGGAIDYIDLDIDIIVWPDGQSVVLDVEEFEENTVKYGYPEEIRAKALSTLDEINSFIVEDSTIRGLTERLKTN